MLAIKPLPLEGVASTHRDVVLRDLAWLAVTPDVVELPPPFPQAGRPSLAELGLGESLDDWLQQLAIPVMAGNGHRASRMGHYHERLWHWLLERAPNACLLGHNLRITRRRNTLGELDMLYRRRDNPAPVHLEVAIKFYLGLPDGPGAVTDQGRWIGPGGLDSLALKCRHLQRHQLPLSATPLALDTLRHWLTPRDLGSATHELAAVLAQRLAMPGVLFYPWHAPLPPPEGATPGHRRGRWCHVSDWPALAATLPGDYRIAWLEKPHWLAPPPLETFMPPGMRVEWLTKALYQPQQVIVYCPAEQRSERLFIVPDNWPRQIPLPPR